MLARKSNLVIQTAFLGDLILAVPVLRRIKILYPDDRLIVLCKSGLGEFLLKEQLTDEVIEIEKSNSTSYRKALRDLRQFDIRNLYCLHRSVRSMLFADRVKADRKIGFSSLLAFWIFDDVVEYRIFNPDVIRQFAILETTDPDTFKEINSQDFSKLNNSRMPAVPPFFSFAGRPVTRTNKQVALFPGSVWATKKWTTGGFTDLSRLFLDAGYKVDLFGGPDEKGLCQEIAAKVPGVNVVAGQLSIAETIRQLRTYKLVISNDSAPTHMAAYNDVPVVTIFGPTSLEQGFRPWSNRAAVVENAQLECRPCGRHGHRECPLGHHNCMKSISAVEVYDQAMRILN